MARKNSERSTKVIYPELGYRVQGAIFKVYKTLGPFHKEGVYQRALAQEFENKGLGFEREKSISVKYEGKVVGTYRPDFVVEGKILIEIKALKSVPRPVEKQLFYYLAGTKYKLGLLVNFGQSGRVYIKRWVS